VKHVDSETEKLVSLHVIGNETVGALQK